MSFINKYRIQEDLKIFKTIKAILDNIIGSILFIRNDLTKYAKNFKFSSHHDVICKVKYKFVSVSKEKNNFTFLIYVEYAHVPTHKVYKRSYYSFIVRNPKMTGYSAYTLPNFIESETKVWLMKNNEFLDGYYSLVKNTNN